jgi:signal transduction histidine kinase/DNA-binding response OmpR family regulator
MKLPGIQEILARIDRYLYDPRLDAEALLRKRWAWLWLIFTFIGVSGTIIYYLGVLKTWPTAWSGAVFMAGYIIGFPIYRRAKRFDIVLNLIFTLFIITIFFTILQIGGLPTNLGYVFVGLNCSMGSVLAGNKRWTIGLFGLYLLTIILVGVFQPYLETPEYITPRVNTIGFVASTIWITACILLLMMLFVQDQQRFERAKSDRLRKIDEAKTQLYTNVSHEFRTPLTMIQGIAEQLEKNPGKWLDQGPAKIRTHSQVLLRLVNQMLDISKIEADGMVLEPVHGDLGKFIRHVAGSFSGLAENRRIDLEVITDDEPVFTDYDPDKLMQVLANLLSNALKFTPGGGTVTVEVMMGRGNPGDKAVINVIDTGRGIPRESLVKVFERFYQVPDQHEQTPGTGLGLAVTRELIVLMDGDIRVESIPDQGSTFTITLPLSNNAPPVEDHGIGNIHPGTINAIIPSKEPVNEIEAGTAAGEELPMLLIVEDNADVREYLLAILQGRYRIEMGRNGREGLEKAIKNIPDIILTDVMMPVMDGFELLRHLREDHRTDHIPVVVLTARGDVNSKITGLEIGADHYLVKPFSEHELLLKLHNLLDARQRMQQMFGNMHTQHIREAIPFAHERKFIEKINSLLLEQLPNEEFGIKELCQHLYMSRPQLYRKFTAITDWPIGKYIRSFRLQKAREMIEHQGKNVSEAAMDTGFKNLSHFSTTFRAEFGFPPSKLIYNGQD